MPYASAAQRGFFHTGTARAKGISAATTREFDQASRGLKLPAHAPDPKTQHAHAMRGLRSAVRGK